MSALVYDLVITIFNLRLISAFQMLRYHGPLFPQTQNQVDQLSVFFDAPRTFFECWHEVVFPVLSDELRLPDQPVVGLQVKLVGNIIPVVPQSVVVIPYFLCDFLD